MHVSPNQKALFLTYVYSPLKGDLQIYTCKSYLVALFFTHQQPSQRRFPKVMHVSPNQRHRLSYTSVALSNALFLKSYIDSPLKGDSLYDYTCKS